MQTLTDLFELTGMTSSQSSAAIAPGTTPLHLELTWEVDAIEPACDRQETHATPVVLVSASRGPRVWTSDE
jgi:hypothetical protein